MMLAEIFIRHSALLFLGSRHQNGDAGVSRGRRLPGQAALCAPGMPGSPAAPTEI